MADRGRGLRRFRRGLSGSEGVEVDFDGVEVVVAILLLRLF